MIPQCAEFKTRRALVGISLEPHPDIVEEIGAFGVEGFIFFNATARDFQCKPQITYPVRISDALSVTPPLENLGFDWTSMQAYHWSKKANVILGLDGIHFPRSWSSAAILAHAPMHITAPCSFQVMNAALESRHLQGMRTVKIESK